MLTMMSKRPNVQRFWNTHRQMGLTEVCDPEVPLISSPIHLWLRRQGLSQPASLPRLHEILTGGVDGLDDRSGKGV